MFDQQLRNLRRANKLTQNELAKILNVSNGTIAMWETGKRQPDFITLVKISQYFNVSLDHLLDNKSNNIGSAHIGTSHVRIPVYGTIPAGIPIEMIDTSYIEDYEDIDAELLKGGNKYFALKVKGDSMLPKFENGDVLILKQQNDCDNGSFCAVSINHTECTFKKVIKKPNGITLMPLNTQFDPLFFSNKEVEELPVTILGVVKEVRRSY